MEGKPKPVKALRSGMLRVACWDNEKTDKLGKKFLTRSFTLTKSWVKQDGSYEDRKLPLNKSDITDLSVLLRFIEDNFHTEKEIDKKAEDVEAFL